MRAQLQGFIRTLLMRASSDSLTVSLQASMTLQAHNAALAAWAESAGVRAEYINFGMLAKTPGGPAAGAGGNWHYQCFLQVLVYTSAEHNRHLSIPLSHCLSWRTMWALGHFLLACERVPLDTCTW